MKEAAAADVRPAQPQRSGDPASGSGGGAGANTGVTNFEYEDNEWDVGIGDLIIDLDADIEKNNDGGAGGGSGGGAAAGAAGGADAAAAGAKMGVKPQHSSSIDKGLKMKIKRTSKPGRSSEAKHEIVPHSDGAAAKTGAGGVTTVNSGVNTEATSQPSSPQPQANAKQARAAGKRAGVHKRERRDREPTIKVERCENGVSGDREDSERSGSGESEEAETPAPTPANTPNKRIKTEPGTQGVSDMCVGTDGYVSRGTLMEPESLGPCEPGTYVSLEGIVWQETCGGVLVVNVTWRGKTYVGTLLDYTQHHDWAPPRFTDSPTAELETRGKGRGKRGRGAASASESCVAETRASAQSKLRSQVKRRSTANSVGAGFAAPASPVKRKGRGSDRDLPDRSTPNKRSRTSSQTSQPEPAASAPSTPESAAPSPAPVLTEDQLIVCPEPNCSKKYRHLNGLRYHQSHAHANGVSEGERETGESSPSESPPPTSQPATTVSTVASSTPASTVATTTTTSVTSSSSTTPVTTPAVSTPATKTPPASPPTTAASSVATPATSPVTPAATTNPTRPGAATAESTPPVAAAAPLTTTPAVVKPIKPVPAAAVTPVTATPTPVAPAMPVAPPPVVTAPLEPLPPTEPRPTHAKVHISDSNGNVKTSGVLRFGPAATAAAAPLPSVIGAASAAGTTVPQPGSLGGVTTAGGPLRASAPVYQPSPMVTRPSPVPLTTAPVRTAPVDAVGKQKPRPTPASVVRAVAPSVAPGLPVIAVAPSPSPAVTYSQSVAHLKPIQPKPTILGEPTPPNPALEALRRDREKDRPKKRRKENGGARTPESSPRTDGSVESQMRPAGLPPTAAGIPVSVPIGVGPRAPRPDGERPPRDGTASPAYSDISDDGEPVDATARTNPAVSGLPPGVPVSAAGMPPMGDKKDGPPPSGAPGSVYYPSFFQAPGAYVPPPQPSQAPRLKGVVTSANDIASKDRKDEPSAPPPRVPPGAEYPPGQLPYYSYPYLPAGYPYAPLDATGYPLPVMLDPKYKAEVDRERERAAASSSDRDSDASGVSAPPVSSQPPAGVPRAAHTGSAPAPRAHTGSPQPAPAHRSTVATPPRLPPARAQPSPSPSLSVKRPSSTTPAGQPPPGPKDDHKRSLDVSAAAAAAAAARSPAFGFASFGLFPGVLLGGAAYHPRFPASPAGPPGSSAPPAAPEDLSRAAAAYSAASRASDSSAAAAAAAAAGLHRQSAYFSSPSHKLLELQERSRGVPPNSAATAGGSPRPVGSPLSAPTRPPLPTTLGFPPTVGYSPYPGVTAPGPSPGFTPIK